MVLYNTIRVSMGIYSGRIIKVDPDGNETTYANAECAETDTPFSNRNKIGQCALGKRGLHAGCKWKYEVEEELEGECWSRDPVTGVMCSNMGRYILLRNQSQDTEFGFVNYGSKDIHGYMVYTWNKTCKLVHRMIARAFLGEPPIDEKGKAFDVDHIDGNKRDNRVSNLQYMSRLEHARKTRTSTAIISNPHTREVERISADLQERIIFTSVQKAAESVGRKFSGGISSACKRSSMVGDWNVQFEDSIGMEPPEFGGFGGRPGQIRRILAINTNTSEVRTYENGSECAGGISASNSIVSMVCKRSNYCCGYFWRFTNKTDSYANEEWRTSCLRPVEVSSHGRVRMKNGCILNEFSSWGDSMYKRYAGEFVHRLVAHAFLGPPPLELNGRPYDVDHIDGHADNNHISNLSYISRLDHNRKTHSSTTRNSSHKRVRREKVTNVTGASIFKRGKDTGRRIRRWKVAPKTV